MLITVLRPMSGEKDSQCCLEWNLKGALAPWAALLCFHLFVPHTHFAFSSGARVYVGPVPILFSLLFL